jgi:hypothetical protein
MALSLEAVPTVLDAQKNELKAYTDSAVSGLETRLTAVIQQQIQTIEQRMQSVMEQQRREHDDEMRSIGSKLDVLTSSISTVSSGFNAWETQLEHVAGMNTSLRQIEDRQTQQAEALTTLQSDIYGQPARGRATIFGLINDLTEAVGKLTAKVGKSSEWIESETIRQAEARQRWANRQLAALQLAQAIPLKSITAAIGIGGSALFIFLKAIGG